MAERVCANCIYWSAGLGALPRKLRDGIKEIVGEGGMSAVYGKCRAEWVDTDGDHKLDMGTLGSTPCKVKDSEGRYLFEEVPE